MRITKKVLQDEIKSLNKSMQSNLVLDTGKSSKLPVNTYILVDNQLVLFTGNASDMFYFIQGFKSCYKYYFANNEVKSVPVLNTVEEFLKRHNEFEVIAKKIPTHINYFDNLLHVYTIQKWTSTGQNTVKLFGKKVCYYEDTNQGIYPCIDFCVDVIYKDDWTIEDLALAALEQVDDYILYKIGKSVFFNKSYILNVTDTRFIKMTGHRAPIDELTKEVKIERISGF